MVPQVASVAGVGHREATASDLFRPVQFAQAVFSQAHPVPAAAAVSSRENPPAVNEDPPTAQTGALKQPHLPRLRVRDALCAISDLLFGLVAEPNETQEQKDAGPHGGPLPGSGLSACRFLQVSVAISLSVSLSLLSLPTHQLVLSSASYPASPRSRGPPVMLST